MVVVVSDRVWLCLLEKDSLQFFHRNRQGLGRTFLLPSLFGLRARNTGKSGPERRSTSAKIPYPLVKVALCVCVYVCVWGAETIAHRFSKGCPFYSTIQNLENVLVEVWDEG